MAKMAQLDRTDVIAAARLAVVHFRIRLFYYF